MKRLLVYLRARRKAKRALSGRRISRKNRKLLNAEQQAKAAQLELNYNEDGNSMGYC